MSAQQNLPASRASGAQMGSDLFHDGFKLCWVYDWAAVMTELDPKTFRMTPETTGFPS